MNAVFIAFARYFSKYFGPKESSPGDLPKSSGSYKTGGSAKMGLVYYVFASVYVYLCVYSYICMNIYTH
jgi:hypothetical protein